MSSVSPQDLGIARGLAEQVQQAASNGQRRTWRKVSTLVAEFGGTRLTESLRERMAAAIDEVGLATEPPLNDPLLTRADSVRLLTRGLPEVPAPHLEGPGPSADPSLVPDDTSAVAYTVWVPGEAPQMTGPIPDSRTPVMLLQVNPNAEPADKVLEVMQPHCKGLLTPDLVENLLKADTHPDLDADTPNVRRLSTVGVETNEEDYQPGEDGSLVGSLIIAPVEYLIGDGWLVICWHNFTTARTEIGANGVGALRREVMAQVSEAWQQSGARTAGDLAALVTIQLARRHSAALRQMEAWLDQWEQKAVRATEGQQLEVQTLVDIQIQLSEFSRRLHWFRDIKSMNGDTWFPKGTSQELQRDLAGQIDRSLERLDYLRSSVRACSDLANMHNLRYQLDQSDRRHLEEDRSRRRVEDFQRNLSYLAAIFLAPSLVAGIFGANTELPGLNTWFGFALMLMLMFAAGTLALISIWRYRARQERKAAELERESHFGLPA